MALLQLLIEARPRALSKAELHDRLWPDAFVSDTSLAQLVTELRRGLGDDAREPRFLRTIHRHGYAFCGPDPQSATDGDAPRLSHFSVMAGSREVRLSEGENLLGRTPEAVVRLDTTKASRRHARIVVSGAKAVLEDLGSKNGTFLNDKRVADSLPITAGDRIVVGRDVLHVIVGPSLESTETDRERGQSPPRPHAEGRGGH